MQMEQDAPNGRSCIYLLRGALASLENGKYDFGCAFFMPSFIMKTFILLAILLASFAANAQSPLTDSLRNEMLYRSGRELEQYRELQSAAVGTELAGTAIITTNALILNQKPGVSNVGIYIGGGMLLTGYILAILSHHRIGNAGLLLQMASGHIPIHRLKTYTPAAEQSR